MKALILRSDADAAVATARVLIEKGFQVLCVESHKVAYALVRLDTINLLVMDETINGHLTHSLALSGERRNPYLSAILLTDRIGSQTDDLYDLIPCLHALVGLRTPASLLGQLAVTSVSNKDAIAARVAQNEMQDAAETAPVDLNWDGFDVTEQAPVAFDDDTPNIPSFADIAATAPALDDVDAHLDDLDGVDDLAVDVAPLFGPFKPLAQPPAQIAKVSIIGEGRPTPTTSLQ
ncbi:imidazoleglycerol-phosphate dehydratase [Loktanella sp. D2R18]|uniref:imidazoleglycerol-phosphate dehydratase n=1 Tax=Rhodobacterales TaxID=204455 RepID=UPI000DE847C4|nr:MULTISPECIES: imidazoleglycerol-phosphate dehydratase [Rhodobacterales]MDO6590237.1 imidazoleglycerol-phosphate dehydratase [Yoonia sp. 1_MG-2023]RBW42946.1 imidazoleglycerol-phosphate dehydratase [Loktanella sp. D2R18]